MKFFLLFLSLFGSLCYAMGDEDPYHLEFSVQRERNEYHVKASFEVPLNACQAYAFLTDYERDVDIPGVIESKIVSRDAHKALVDRLVRETILMIPIQIRTRLEFNERSFRTIEFRQIQGDNVYMKGQWQIEPNGKQSLLKYENFFEPNLNIPNFIIDFFIKNRLNERILDKAKTAQAFQNSEFKCQ